MHTRHLDQPLEIHSSDLDQWNQRPLIYQFFEIVQILEGEGTRIVNQNNFSYQKGSIFLFTPLDCRGFKSHIPTKFCSIRFSEVFIEQDQNPKEKQRRLSWLKQLESIFTAHNRFVELLIEDDADCAAASQIIRLILAENQKKGTYYEENLQHYITLLLNIIARNVQGIATQKTKDTQEEPLINKMLVYIHRHITSPEKLKIKHLAQAFNLSANYVGEYFKNLTGESLRCYINDYRQVLLRQKLQYSLQTLDQLADEFGFTDSSHLSRHFKKHQQISPKDYRKKMQQKSPNNL